MKHHKTPTDNHLHHFVTELGPNLCWIAFLITGDWELTVEAVASVFEPEEMDTWPLSEWTILRARRLVVAASIAAISRELIESASRTAWAPAESFAETIRPLLR